MNYYNEHDRYAAAWLRTLIAEGHLPDGHVDERDIQLVQPPDLAGYTQCHFFAGIGGWSHALRLAGWSEDRPVWTGSCPCQPFSSAGERRGVEDERHLWPAFFRLIAQCRPPVVFGEQVASKAGLGWLDGVCADLEGAAYAVGAADLCAAGVGAPHIRQRLYWVADAYVSRRDGSREGLQGTRGPSIVAGGIVTDSRLAHPNGWNTGTERQQRSRKHGQQQQEDGGTCGLAYPIGERGCSGHGQRGHANDAAPSGDAYWDRSQWIDCRGSKKRRIPVEPSFQPLAHGVPGRVGLLRGYGNAIVPQVAAQFVASYLEVT